MKINFKSTIPVTIGILIVALIVASTIKYGTDPLWWFVVGGFSVLGGIILASVIITKRKK